MFIIFLISALKDRLWVLASANNLCFKQKCVNIKVFNLNIFCFGAKFSIYLNRRVFVMLPLVTDVMVSSPNQTSQGYGYVLIMVLI